MVESSSSSIEAFASLTRLSVILKAMPVRFPASSSASFSPGTAGVPPDLSLSWVATYSSQARNAI